MVTVQQLHRIANQKLLLSYILLSASIFIL